MDKITISSGYMVNQGRVGENCSKADHQTIRVDGRHQMSMAFSMI